MTDRPILFSAPMIRALLDGRKTQTRRVLKLGAMLDPMPDVWEAKEIDGVWHFVSDNPECGGRQKAPVRFGKGDRLYVREAWRTLPRWDHLKPTELLAADPVVGVFYEAGGDLGVNVAEGVVQQRHFGWRSKPREDSRLRAGMHLPRWASRLTLTVTDVRVQRLQEISEADALAEGAHRFDDIPLGKMTSALKGKEPDRWSMEVPADTDHCLVSPRWAFANYFAKLNNEAVWDANPFVVAVSFTVERRNIDAARAA